MSEKNLAQLQNVQLSSQSILMLRKRLTDAVEQKMKNGQGWDFSDVKMLECDALLQKYIALQMRSMLAGKKKKINRL